MSLGNGSGNSWTDAGDIIPEGINVLSGFISGGKLNFVEGDEVKKYFNSSNSKILYKHTPPQPNYYYIEVHQQHTGNLVALNELSFYKNTSTLVPFSSSLPNCVAFDEATNGYPLYWNDPVQWNRHGLNDGIETYNYENSCVILGVTSTPHTKTARILLDFGAANVNEINRIRISQGADDISGDRKSTQIDIYGVIDNPISTILAGDIPADKKLIISLVWSETDPIIQDVTI